MEYRFNRRKRINQETHAYMLKNCLLRLPWILSLLLSVEDRIVVKYNLRNMCRIYVSLIMAPVRKFICVRSGENPPIL